MLFFTSGKFAIVVFKDDPVSRRTRGQFFDHLVNFALVSLLGGVLRDLEEVQDFLAFLRLAGLFGLFGLKVIADGCSPRSEQASRAFGLHRGVSGLPPKLPEMLNNFVMFDRRLFNGREGLLTGLKKHLVDINFLRRGAGSVLLNPVGNRITQLLRHRIVAACCLVQSCFIKGHSCSLARRQQKVIHDSEVGLESKVSNVKPPCAYGRFGDSDSFRLGIRCSESRKYKVYLARSGLVVGGLIELGGLWRAAPCIEGGESVAL